MNKLLRYIILCICVIQQIQGQEDGVVALELPIRNSLKFNQYTLNPTFSFVREQNRYISLTNKRQWVQFDDAPQTYLFSYSGRFRENIGAGIGVFQQDYGVLTTFGGVLNFAYNAALNRDSNLTFGMNIGFYKSGLNEGRVVTNFSDPSLDNIPSNSVLTVNPGINYGTAFFDFGLSVNNAVAYNFNTSEMLNDNPEQAIQAHIMYTGYMNSRGFLDESKFSTLLRSEFKNDETVLSGIAMLLVPKGIWMQAGYNTKYGFSAGLGLNITQEIALEYNYEQAIGDFSNFGNSHEITLAYKLKEKSRFNYSGDDDEQALIMPSRKSRRVASTRSNTQNRNLVRKKRVPRVKEEPVAVVSESKEEESVVEKTEEELIEEQRLKAIEIEAKRKEEERLKAEAEAKAQQEEAARIKAEQLEKERLEREAKLKADRARIAREAKLKAEAEEKARAEEQARLAAAEKLRVEQEAQAKLEEERRLKEEAEARLKAESEAQAKLEEEERLRKEEEARIKTQDLDGVIVPVAKNDVSREMNGLIELTNKSRIEQQNLLNELTQKVASKQQDLDDLKEENDLSEQGIYKEKPRVFKSISAENQAIESLKVNLDNLIQEQELQINKLDKLYREVAQKEDSIATIYLDAILILKKAQEKAKREKQSLVSELLEINKATEIERKRRIKRAKYDNEQDRYRKDRQTLDIIRNNTDLSSEPLSKEDFNSGEELDNIQIVKDVSNTDSGYYLVVAVHSDVEKRDEFLRKAVAAGEKNIDFFFDVNTNKYYIYYEKHDYIDAANRGLEAKGSKPYNANMSMVKIEN